jgi:hypothetical protein
MESVVAAFALYKPRYAHDIVEVTGYPAIEPERHLFAIH